MHQPGESESLQGVQWWSLLMQDRNRTAKPLLGLVGVANGEPFQPEHHLGGSGRPLTLPAYEPVETYAVRVEGGSVPSTKGVL